MKLYFKHILSKGCFSLGSIFKSVHSYLLNCLSGFKTLSFIIFVSLLMMSCGGAGSEGLSLDTELNLSNQSLFLTEDDEIDFTPGEGAGFGQDRFPDIILGEPQSDSLDVLSFGSGGILTIELINKKIINGDGADFTIFENPFLNFAERAQVSVSVDGEEFFDFDCEVDLQEENYPGCAGVNPVNYDADFSLGENIGGDGFDLEELGLDEIRFIRITDLGTCQDGDITYPVCAFPGKQGFDLDGIYFNHLLLDETN